MQKIQEANKKKEIKLMFECYSVKLERLTFPITLSMHEYAL